MSYSLIKFTILFWIKQRTFNSKKIIITLVVLILIPLGVFTLKIWDQRLEKETSPEETTQILETLGKAIDLPQAETPTIATILDVEEVQKQAFFAQARYGDKFIVYQDAKKAILFRPSEGKIINVTNIKVVAPSAPPTIVQEASESAATTPVEAEE